MFYIEQRRITYSLKYFLSVKTFGHTCNLTHSTIWTTTSFMLWYQWHALVKVVKLHAFGYVNCYKNDLWKITTLLISLKKILIYILWMLYTNIYSITYKNLILSWKEFSFMNNSYIETWTEIYTYINTIFSRSTS